MLNDICLFSEPPFRVAGDTQKLLTSSQCWHVKGIPTITLSCPAGQIVKVLSAFYGAPSSNTNGTCQYDSAHPHCTQRTELHENCMGTNRCTLYVSNPYLTDCNVYAKYMQVNYTCIASK